jgi:WD40 repeat protein
MGLADGVAWWPSLSPGGRKFATQRSDPITRNAIVTVFDVATGAELTRIEVPGSLLANLEFAADGSTLSGIVFDRRRAPATPSLSVAEFRSWDTATWQEKPTRRITINPDRMGPAVFSPDGSWLAKPRHPDLFAPEAIIWDLATARPRAVLKSANSPVLYRDRKLLATTSKDGRTRIWDLSPE